VDKGNLFPRFADTRGVQECGAESPDARAWFPQGPDLWRGALIDRPYTEEDAAHYLDGKGAEVLPDLNDLLRRTLDVVGPGCRVGVLDYFVPRPPKGTRFVALVGVVVGFGNRIRSFAVYERPHPRPDLQNTQGDDADAWEEGLGAAADEPEQPAALALDLLRDAANEARTLSEEVSF
jgi:hypothetical protein